MSEINSIAQAQIDRIAVACSRIKPKVVITSLAYNHELYVKDALEGFVMQKTNFPVVAIVHEDCSTDNTARIIEEYQKKYPDIIFPIFEEENQYSKQNGTLSHIMRTAIAASGAKYVAMCEGDDYWTDPLKLQKQVDFLESHPDYSMCFHTVNVLHQNTDEIVTKCNMIENRSYTAEEIFDEWVVPTCSAVMRKCCVVNKPNHPDFIVGDNVLWASCLSMGRIYGMNEAMGVYRRIAGGWTARINSSRRHRYESSIKWIKHYQAMIPLFPEIDKSIFENKIVDYMASSNVVELITFKRGSLRNFNSYHKKYGSRFVQRLFYSFYTILKHKIRMMAQA